MTNPQAMHAAVRAAFPPDLDESVGRVLWRLDSRGFEHVLYIVGPERPDTHHLVEQGGWMTRPAETADYSNFINGLMRGQQWRFELVANPVSARARERGQRGALIHHVTAEQQLAWLFERSEKEGFRIREADNGLQARATERNVLRFRRTAERKTKPITLHTARFEGVLEVTDASRLGEALNNGVGRAKAYGCGLLTLAKPGP